MAATKKAAEKKSSKKSSKKKATGAEADALADDVKADHAKSGRPVSPTDDPTVHATSAASLAGQLDPSKKSGATVNAESIEKVGKKADEKEAAELKAAEEDNSIAGKLARSGLYFVRNHSTGEDYIGESPQNDPNADMAAKTRSAVMPISVHPPRTGLQVRPKDGEAFTIGDGFGPDATPADWARVTTPDGKPFFA